MQASIQTVKTNLNKAKGYELPKLKIVKSYPPNILAKLNKLEKFNSGSAAINH